MYERNNSTGGGGGGGGVRILIKDSEISLFHMDRLMMDYFSPTFQKFFVEPQKSPKKWIYIISESISVFIGYSNWCKHGLHLVIE